MFSTLHTPVDPVRPVGPWIGGKRNLARRLGALIEATPHDLYAEPFVGMGGVFFHRRSRPKCEIINDWSGEVADQLAAMKGRFILSLNDRPEVREIFGTFDIEGVGTHYGLAGRGAAAAREVIITGGG